MKSLFPLTQASRLAGLSLEATNEAARVLRLKVTTTAGDSGLTFKGVGLLRDLAPDLLRGVTPDVAYRTFCAAAREQNVREKRAAVFQLRPSMPNPGAARLHLEEARQILAKPTTIRYERELNLAAAERLLRRTIALDPTIAIVWCDLADVLWERSSPRSACAQLWHRALELDPDMVGALYAIGALALQEGFAGAAEVYVARACRLAPQEPRLFALLATVYTSLDRSAEAEVAMTQARALEETHRRMAAPG